MLMPITGGGKGKAKDAAKRAKKRKAGLCRVGAGVFGLLDQIGCGLINRLCPLGLLDSGARVDVLGLEEEANKRT